MVVYLLPVISHLSNFMQNRLLNAIIFSYFQITRQKYHTIQSESRWTNFHQLFRNDFLTYFFATEVKH